MSRQELCNPRRCRSLKPRGSGIIILQMGKLRPKHSLAWLPKKQAGPGRGSSAPSQWALRARGESDVRERNLMLSACAGLHHSLDGVKSYIDPCPAEGLFQLALSRPVSSGEEGDPDVSVPGAIIISCEIWKTLSLQVSLVIWQSIPRGHRSGARPLPCRPRRGSDCSRVP